MGKNKKKYIQIFHKAHDTLIELYRKPKGVLRPIRGNMKKEAPFTSRQNIVIDTDDTRRPSGRACRIINRKYMGYYTHKDYKYIRRHNKQ